MKLKKFLAIILTTITAACVAVGFSGCKEEIKLPPMTAESPYYNFNDLNNLTQIQGFDNYGTIAKDSKGNPYVVGKSDDSYGNFLNYYNGDFKQISNNRFYILNPQYEEVGEFPPYLNYRGFKVYKNSDDIEESVNSLISEEIELFDNELGHAYDKNHYQGEPMDGVKPLTISICWIATPIANKLSGKLSLEFGEYICPETWRYDHFINLFIGDTCIGTCYYGAEVEIPLTWYQKYFTSNIFYGE